MVLKYLLTVDRTFEVVAKYEKTGSSELLVMECCRVFERYRLQNLIDDEQLAELRQRLERITRDINLIEISASVKRRAAGAFPTAIGTLDAIHLASALAWREIESESELELFSFDRQLCVCAQALGLRVHQSY